MKLTPIDMNTHPQKTKHCFGSQRSRQGHSFAEVFLWTFALAGLALISPARSFGQDDGQLIKDVLSKKNYPWYDQANDTAGSVRLPERPPARSADRNEVPLGSPQTKQAANTPNSTGNFPSLGFNFVAWTLVAVAIAVLGGFLIWAFFRLESQQIRRGGQNSQRSLAESIQQLPFQVDQRTGDFRSLAQSAYADGDFRRAITYLFSHVLVTLDQKNLIRLRKGKTNRQYLKELKPHGSLATFYQRVMVPFESAFFGDHELSKSEFESCWRELDGFHTGVDQTTQVPA
jgi:hypothetical protein